MKSPIQRQLEIFSAALERSAGPEREAFIAQECADDEALRQSVDLLLASHNQAGTFLVNPAVLAPHGTVVAPVIERAGDKIGRYKLLQQIGEGGMGVVWMAEQEEPVRRRVALKIIKAGMDTKAVIARFEAERQALAMMDHPNIAKVFDGGVTRTTYPFPPDGTEAGNSLSPISGARPYFVMELVRGIKITDYCDQAHLSTEERLNLFMQVCQAVQHAHQKGIIHRDLKPSNILVTLNDGVAVPKVIDFGIAKATDQRLTDKTYFTQFEAFIGTPAYTSPEQAEMSSLDIDTRSDIYSLGVLLYELLTGQTPFPAERLLQSGLDEMRRIIREEEPPRPSTRLTTLGLADATELSRKRQAKIPQLASAVQGDLDWIVMKALEKDRSRRYATSLEFAADLQRHLNNEAVFARPPSLAYKFQRAVRRNKGAFAAAAAVIVALLTGLGLTAWQAVRASRAEHHARLSAEKARADRDRAVLAESDATQHANAATDALQTAQERMVKLHTAEGWRRVEEGDYLGALLPFAQAFAMEQNDPERGKPHQLRLGRLLQASPKLVDVWSMGEPVLHAEFNRDGSRLLTASGLSNRFVARVWDCTTGRSLTEAMEHSARINSLEWSRDESRVATASINGIVRAWDAATGRPLCEPLRHQGSVVRARFSPDGARIASLSQARVHNPEEGSVVSCKRLSVWSVASSQLTGTHMLERGAYNHPLLFTPDGCFVITFHGLHDGIDATLRSPLRDLSFTETMFMSWTDGKERPAFFNNESDEEIDALHASSDFSADEVRLFVCPEPGEAASLRDGEDPNRIIVDWDREDANVVPVLGQFSPDGSLLATANQDWTLATWDSASGAIQAMPMKHKSQILDLRFSRHGRYVATGTTSGEAQVWDARSGKPVSPILPHPSAVLRVAFSHDHTRLLVLGQDGTVAVWSLVGFDAPRFTWSIPGLNVDRATAFPGTSRALLSSESDILLTRSTESTQTAAAWSLVTGELRLPPLLKETWSWVPLDSDRLLSAHSGQCSVLDLLDGSLVTRNIATHFRAPNTNIVHAQNSVPLALDTNPGRWIAAYQDGGTEVLVVDAATGALSARLDRSGLPNKFFSTLARQDGRQVLATLEGATSGQRGAKRVVCWNVGQSSEPVVVRTDGWYPLAYSRSGKLVAFMGGSGFKVLETETFREVLGNEWLIQQSSFNDHWIIASHGLHDRWQIHSTTNPSLKSPVLTHRGSINCGDFTTNNRIAITAGDDLKVRFWSVPEAEPVLLPVCLPSEAMAMEATGDGRGFITVHADDTIRFWELPKSQRHVADWLALGRFFSSGRAKQAVIGNAAASAAVVGHKTQEGRRLLSFRDEWLVLRAKHPQLFTISADEIDSWRRHEALRYESRKDWSNAVVHLSALLEAHPDSGDFLPRRAAAYVAMATNLSAEATNFMERALADYNRTLAWVDRFPAIAKESRAPFVEKRREVYVKLGRKAEGADDERELKALSH